MFGMPLPRAARLQARSPLTFAEPVWQEDGTAVALVVAAGAVAPPTRLELHAA